MEQYKSFMTIIKKMRDKGLSEDDQRYYSEVFGKTNEICKQANLNRDLKTNLAAVFSIYPMKDNKINAYKKSSIQEKAGILSSHLISVARKVGVSSVAIQEYETLKYQWGYTSRCLKKVSRKDEEQMIRDMFSGEDTRRSLDKVFSHYKDLERKNMYNHLLLRKTFGIIEMILEKY